MISRDPFACTWLWREDRTPRVRLLANPKYWDSSRGPHLSEVIFRNDLSPQQALDLICTTEGEVDILTEVVPANAARVQQSEHARLVTIDALRSVVGLFNRDSNELPLSDKRVRLALNHAVDRNRLVRETMFGHATPLAGLTPYPATTFLHRLLPYAYETERATALWREAGLGSGQRLRIAAVQKLEPVAEHIAADFQAALGIAAEVTIYRDREEELTARRRLAERETPRPWDILLLEHGPQEADGPPLELHRAFVGANGEYRAGPVVPEFERLYAEFVQKISPDEQASMAHDIDRFVYDEALALFLCAPQALYAVNQHVDFTAYRTTFELAESQTKGEHWSRR